MTALAALAYVGPGIGPPREAWKALLLAIADDAVLLLLLSAPASSLLLAAVLYPRALELRAAIRLRTLPRPDPGAWNAPAIPAAPTRRRRQVGARAVTTKRGGA